MSFVDIFGWVCAAVGACLSLPQAIRLVRSRTSAGVSLLSWQLMLGAICTWLLHGFLMERANLIAANGVAAATILAVVVMIRRDRNLGLTQTFWPAIVTFAACAAVDIWLGPLAFGIFVIAPQSVAVLAQYRDLRISLDVSGVSGGFLLLSVVVQALWFTWSLLAVEYAVMAAASITMVLCLANLVLYLLRVSGTLPAKPVAATTMTP